MTKFWAIQAVFLASLFLSPIGDLESIQPTKEPSMNSTTPLIGTPSEYSHFTDNSIETIEAYFKNFESLAKTEQWEEIISQGTMALETARKSERPQDEAKICAQLTSTAFYLGDYPRALVYAHRCHELSERFVDSAFFVRALYLESAIHRATAAKNDHEQASYARAVQIAEEALLVYQTKGVDNRNLEGKVYFNLGAAHADNPKGDLVRAEDSYIKALECFKITQATDDLIRTHMRLGKIYLLQKKYDLSQKIIDEVRPQIMTERLAMHADYLEAQLKFAVNDIDTAIKIAGTGLARAKALKAKEDECRLASLLQTIESAQLHHIE